MELMRSTRKLMHTKPGMLSIARAITHLQIILSSPKKRFFRLAFLGLILLPMFLTACGSNSTENSAGSSGITLLWEYEAGDNIYSSSIVMDDVIFIASEDNHVYALNKASGAVVWDFEVPGDVWSFSLMGGDGRLFISTKGGTLYAIDVSSGNMIWSKNLGIDTVHIPLLKDGKLYVPTTYVWFGLPANVEGKAKLFVLDPATGSLLWEFESDNYILITPLIDGNTLYLSGSWSGGNVNQGGHMRIYSLDLASCEAGSCTTNWTYESEDGLPKKVSYYGGVVSYAPYKDYLRGVDANTGELLWSYYTENWVNTYNAYGGVIYFTSANNKLHAIDHVTGEIVWIYKIPGPAFNYAVAEPQFYDGVLYFLSISDARIFAIDMQAGSLLWASDETGFSNPHQGGIFSDMVFIMNKNIMYAFSMD